MILGLRGCADLADAARADRADVAVTFARRCADQLNDLHQRDDPNGLEPDPVRPAAAAEKLTWQPEWSRLQGEANPSVWEQAAATWDAIARPHTAAYARWRQAAALLTMPGGRASAAAVLRTAAHQATQHVPLSYAIHNLARRAHIELAVHAEPPPTPAEPHSAAARYGLTDRELLVLQLVAAGHPAQARRVHPRSGRRPRRTRRHPQGAITIESRTGSRARPSQRGGPADARPQTTSTARPAATLNLAEIADRYTGLLYGIGHLYRGR